MTFLTIGSNFIDPNKIIGMSNEDGRIYIMVTGGDTLDFCDMQGSRFATLLDEWREYLETREANLRNDVQYGIILAAERGAFNVKGM